MTGKGTKSGLSVTADAVAWTQEKIPYSNTRLGSDCSRDLGRSAPIETRDLKFIARNRDRIALDRAWLYIYPGLRVVRHDIKTRRRWFFFSRDDFRRRLFFHEPGGQWWEGGGEGRAVNCNNDKLKRGSAGRGRADERKKERGKKKNLAPDYYWDARQNTAPTRQQVARRRKTLRGGGCQGAYFTGPYASVWRAFAGTYCAASLSAASFCLSPRPSHLRVIRAPEAQDRPVSLVHV